MTTYLVGLDGSAASAFALRWAAELAGPNHGAILAIHAWELGQVDSHSRRRAAASAKESAQRWLDEVGLDAGIDVQLHLREGDPREVLRAVCQTEQPDLVVLGRGGDRLGIGPEHLGRVAVYMARHTPWPLAVIPVGARHHHPRTVVGVDGSPGADAAVEWCARHLAAVATSVIAVDVDEPHGRSDSWQHDEDDRARIRAEIERCTAPLMRVGIEAEAMPLLHQHPADALLHVADDRHADLIVVGSRGRGGFDGLHVGGTALELLRRARAPLVVVPASSDRDTWT